MKSPKPVRLRALSLADLDEAIAYYLQEAGSDVALDFINALPTPRPPPPHRRPALRA